MRGDLGCELLYLIYDLRERGGVAVGQQADAAGEGLGDAVQLALDGLAEGGELFVVHDEGLDLGLGKLRVLLIGKLVERGLGVADGFFEFGFLGVELEPLLGHEVAGPALVLGLKQHEQDVVIVLGGIHAAAQLVARGPEGGVEVGFLDGHEERAER